MTNNFTRPKITNKISKFKTNYTFFNKKEKISYLICIKSFFRNIMREFGRPFVKS